MGILGFVIGLVIGWLAVGYIMSIAPISYPCLVKAVFFCSFSSKLPMHIGLAVLCGLFMKKALPV